MKSILVCFLICFGTTYSQNISLVQSFDPFYFHSSDNSVSVNDSLYDGFSEVSFDYTAELPYLNTREYLYQSLFCRVKENRYVEMITYRDKTRFYKEWSDSARTDLLDFGEVEMDQSSLKINSIYLTSMEGEDSLVLDSVYTFQKIGAWEFRMHDGSILYGIYEHGKRVGKWTNYLSDGITFSSFLPVLATYEYDNGHLKASERIDKSALSYNEKLKILNAKWQLYPLDAKGTALCKQGACILKFHKMEKAKFPCSNHFQGSVMCGTIANKTPLKWEVNEDNTVIIEGMKFTILYLTEEHLLLRVEEN